MAQRRHHSSAAPAPLKPESVASETGQSWRELARCRAVDADLFFHPDGERAQSRKRRILRAKQVCHQCPVIQRCREFALARREGFGIWGGMSEEERIVVYVTQGARPRGRSIHIADWNYTAQYGQSKSWWT
jgi:WhiB family transcriptional regulator, redox-sensing transcriptional regulator